MKTTQWLLMLTLAAGAGLTASAQSAAEDFYRPSALRGDADADVADMPSFQYTVQSGDNLFTIAKRFLGDPYKASLLGKMNDIADPLELKAGDKIKVPRPNMGILYSIQKRAGDCDLIEVTERHLFSAGDRFQLRLAANVDGYVYLFNRAPDGELVRLVPDAGKTMKLKQFSEYLMPRDDWFKFDGAKGPEELIVLVSLEPLSELDGDLTAVAARNRVAAIVKSQAGKESVIGQGDDGRGRAYVAFSPIDNTMVLAHRIVLKRK